MPYILDETRPEFDTHIATLARAIVQQSPGEHDIEGNLNYCITRLLMMAFKLRFQKFRYWMSTSIKGVLVDVSDEFTWRKLRKYEDKKIAENGDVPEYAQEW